VVQRSGRLADLDPTSAQLGK